MWRVFIVAILLGLVTMTPAHSDTVYAYWSYWQGDTGTWKYALVGRPLRRLSMVQLMVGASRWAATAKRRTPHLLQISHPSAG